MKTCFLCGAGDEIDHPLTRLESAASAESVRFHEKCFSDLKEKIREAELIFCIDKKTGRQKILYGKAWQKLVRDGFKNLRENYTHTDV